MASLKNLLFRRRQLNGVDDYLPRRGASLRGLLYQLVPTSFRAQKYNRQLRREIEERPEGALVVWERDTSDRLYYVFHGMAGGLGIQPLTVLRETGLLQNNLVMLKDHYRFFYQAGLSPEIKDVDAIIARLRKCQEDLPHVRQTFCSGPSSGGYAAILFGHYLKVDVVYAFAPVTSINLNDLKKYGGSKDVSRIPEQHRDLALLLAQHNGHTRYKLFYCQANNRDRSYAEHLRDLPGVELCPQRGTSHNVIQAIHQSGRLRDIFEPPRSDAALQ
jgi:hypothetical protein